MAAKFIQLEGSEPGTQEWMFHCPACQSPHSIATPRWTFDGNVDSPTCTPSLLVGPNTPVSRCHSFIREGKMIFLEDCWHSLKGQTVEIPDWE